MSGQLENRFAMVVSKSLEPGVALNAAAHMAAGLAAKAAAEGKSETMRFRDYVDADGVVYPSISDYPIIVLRARAAEIKRTVEDLRRLGMMYVAFIDTMTLGTYEEQHEKTRSAHSESLTYNGVCMFGPDAHVRELTRKFSLFK